VISATALILLAVVGLGLTVWAIVDAATTPSSAFRAAGKSKGMWISLIAVLYLVTGIIGTVLAIVYLASIRPQVRPYKY
jgi:hypothetical protein